VRAISKEFGRAELVEINDEIEASIEEAENTIAPPKLGETPAAEPEPIPEENPEEDPEE
jgi:hypothetical protein